jgi:hypothetical protein
MELTFVKEYNAYKSQDGFRFVVSEYENNTPARVEYFHYSDSAVNFLCAAVMFGRDARLTYEAIKE